MADWGLIDRWLTNQLADFLSARVIWLAVCSWLTDRQETVWLLLSVGRPYQAGALTERVNDSHGVLIISTQSSRSRKKFVVVFVVFSSNICDVFWLLWQEFLIYGRYVSYPPNRPKLGQTTRNCLVFGVVILINPRNAREWTKRI